MTLQSSAWPRICPGAASVSEFWDNLRSGRSAIRRLSEQELLDAGESAAMLRKPNYVPFAAPLDGFADFRPRPVRLFPERSGNS